ncbi:hypothetical protein MXD81_12525, partial [Microbacteriaceae bacterium K1510]|nr:hypothetical protein [Microbacteriaceae bacterium K1510]
HLVNAWWELSDEYKTPHDKYDLFCSAWKSAEQFKSAEHDKAPGNAAALGKATRVVVLQSIGGTSRSSTSKEVKREFEDIVGQELELVAAADLARVRAILRDEFPHLHAEVDVLLTGLVDGEPVHLPPTLLLGEPGGGKSRLARRLAELLKIGLHRFDGAGSSDNAFGG